jgi:ABC-type transport system involved in multi-copper enzyme maturation permease subunit
VSASQRRIRAIFRKELREYRRNRSVIATMAVIPLMFIIFPLVAVLRLPASESRALLEGHPLAILLGIPALVPAVVAAYSVVGEREQATLEPVLTTPIPREEFLLGKALAVLLPSLAMSYAVYGFFLACVALFAHPAVASAVLQGPEVLAQLLFTPLLAAWSIWVGIAISTRSSEVRVAHRGDLPHRAQRDPRDARPGPRPRCRAVGPRRSRLADRIADVRSRAAHDGDQIVKRAAISAAFDGEQLRKDV